MTRIVKENGASKKITAKVKIKSSNQNVVSVNSNGDTVTAEHVGTATLTYYTDPVHGVEKKISVTVKPDPDNQWITTFLDHRKNHQQACQEDKSEFHQHHLKHKEQLEYI